MFGFLNINKQSGISSHKVISVLRKITGIKQIGHAGTLDPLASGVLPVAIGKASKLIDYLNDDKEYVAGMYLGKTSDTFDIEGKVEKTDFRKIKQEEIENLLPEFTGKIKQVPPAFSAVHYNGKRLYELARKGQIPIDIPSREITVYKNEIVEFDYENQILKLDIACSKGTYIRTIINDIGQALGCGAVMSELTRIKAANMDIKDSIILTDDINKEFLKEKLINPQDIIEMNTLQITEKEYEAVKNGNKFINKSNYTNEILLTMNNNVIALACADTKYIQPKKVLL